METTLNELKPRQKGRIIALKGSGAIHRRLLDMGIVKGVVVEVEKVAPLGDPVEIKVKGYQLSLRKQEASNVVVQVI